MAYFTRRSRTHLDFAFLLVCAGLAATTVVQAQVSSDDLAKMLGISFSSDAPSTIILEKDGKRYSIDAAAKSIRELGAAGTRSDAQNPQSRQAAALVFSQKCASCHGSDGQGMRSVGTPNFHDAAFQKKTTDAAISAAIHNGKVNIMPAWSGKLTEAEMSSLTGYVRSFSPESVGTAQGTSRSSSASAEPAPSATVYEPGDDVLMSLPTGRPLQRHGMNVNFAHRFAYDPAFSGTGRGEVLFGLDGFAIPSFGFSYGITDKLSASISRSPSIVGRPIQLMAAYQLMDEHKSSPFNLSVRVSLEGQNNFRKNFTENIEGIFSRSLTNRAQIYAVPTISFNDRPLVQGGFRSSEILDLPGTNAFSLGFGLAVDVRPTVALVAEVIPTLVNGRDLAIHRPAYAFGIQKKIYRHAFTFGFSTSPGTTVSQRAGTRASFLGDPGADTPGGLFIGFDLMRQVR